MPENERYEGLKSSEFRDHCVSRYKSGDFVVRAMFAADERAVNGCFRIYAVFSRKGQDAFHIPYFELNERELRYSSLTRDIPAVHWYEREIKDMFGITPEGHPDPRRLVFHESFPKESYPLRRDWSMTDAEKIEWGEGKTVKEPFEFLRAEGEGIYEIPVGPVHAGIIEPGHFRFSAVGETIYYLEPRLFYTHKGIEKQFEHIGFHAGVALSERVSGTSSFSHSAAYCMAVERMAGIELNENAKAARTLLLELERLYNHIGDIGNMCAGTGLAVGYARGAVIKEELMRLNEVVTGSRYLRGVNRIGGVSSDIFLHREEILSIIDRVTREYKQFMELLTGTISHMERLENTGILSRQIAEKLGVTGVAARASGIDDDIRKAHPHFMYDRVVFEAHTMSRGDVLARMMVRAEEAECSISIIKAILESGYGGHSAEERAIPPDSCGLGYVESPRGSVFYWVKSDPAGNPLRVKLRSPSFCNWPAVPFAVHGNIVPDFPLCNKSFNLSYSGCDM